LADGGKVICVRLALFAEMVKGKPWTPATLKEAGGTEGVGVTFLEETFAASTANPRHRLHQKAVRAVLKALLPEAGTDIKGAMRSQQELLEVSGYGSHPKDFDDLLRILDGELRLLTPTDPEGLDDGGQPPQRAAGRRYYQLTHDYLVPSLRDWLTRKQKETRRGRAELGLAERAALWNARPQNRHLPAWWEWLNIRLFTRQRDWTSPQRRLMRRAGRFHALRGAALLLALGLLALGSPWALGWLMFRPDRLIKDIGLLIDIYGFWLTVVIVLGIVVLLAIGMHAERSASKRVKWVTVVFLLLVTPLALLLPLIPAIDRAREEAARTQSQNNLKQMALAMRNYHDTYMHLPPAGGEQPGLGMPLPPGQRPKMSWRMGILPYIEQDFLSRQYNPNEEWDGPNNKRLLNQMPKIYQLPGDETAPPGHTYYQVFVGPQAGFENPQGTRFMDVTDGLSNTLMIVEAETAVPWTKPEDLTFNPNGPLPRMSKHFRSGFNVVFMDGSVRLMPHNVPETTLRAMITRNGGEMVIPP
jgi:hypothetical protein